MPPNLPKELSGGLGDDSLLRLLLQPCEHLQRLASYHGVSFPTSRLPVCHDTHIVTARQGKKDKSSCILYFTTAFSLLVVDTGDTQPCVFWYCGRLALTRPAET